MLTLLGCELRIQAQIPTTLENFFQRGTQPDASGGADFEPLVSAENCRMCHEVYDPVEYPIYTRWEGSMMANAARDPLFHACLAIVNQDAAFAGDLCIRCHSPGGWLEGRSIPADGSALERKDFEGVTCNFCHRMVDPVLSPDYEPPPSGDDIIRVALRDAGLLPIRPGGGGFVVDPNDSRRGPFPFDPSAPYPGTVPSPYGDAVRANYHGVPTRESEFHRRSDLCATCHDVSNPAYVRQPDGTYVLNTLGAEHPTGDKFDMFPLERTFSEWSNSLYATVGVDSGGVFGGNHPTGVLRTCQDCHMPDTQAYGCAFDGPPFFERPDVPAHDFNGGNAWMPEVLLNLFPKTLTQAYMNDSRDRAVYMLQNASTLEVTDQDCDIRVRVVNETGHKLPTGYPEGRRMWIEVEFHGSLLEPVAIRGSYDGESADLTTSDTKVYEAVLGIDAAVSQSTGYPVGPSFHFALNNVIYKDNRIPPRGFTQSAFAAVQASPVGADYEDGQYWDDTRFRIPPKATSAVVRLYYQTAAKEYITFLRDENRTNDAGDVLYEQWELTGKSPPVLMKERIITALAAGDFGDANCDGLVVPADYLAVPSLCVTGPDRRLQLGCEVLDAELDGDVDLRDFAAFQRTVD